MTHFRRNQLTALSLAGSSSPSTQPINARAALERAGVSLANPEEMLATLPFSRGDVTAGAESELQVVVEGTRECVDLPLMIEQSNYLANIQKRAASGETSRKIVADLERFLATNQGGVWENSWVRFPRKALSAFANQVFERDLLTDKRNPDGGRRGDTGRFIYYGPHGEEMLRLPVSYLLKLALADLVGTQDLLPPAIRTTATRLMEHFLNDNTSPETFSFNVVALTPETGMGTAIARETALRFLFTQFLVMYANQVFGLEESGQRAMIYFSPHPPVRQKELNNHVSDSFYRELFMSPCLSGWDRGEDKYRYMKLCHKVLSRSQLNAVAKLREAGIIVNNLVVLPNLSNVSLANNGTHISIGSTRLTRALADTGSGFGAIQEKHLGDLVIKISEHFLPLFTGTYSAAPYRLAYTDFHPERALGFLAHELDYTHLRMIWRRWKKKAHISMFGRPVTPFGPEALDSLLSGLFGLKGDFVPDNRLIDYLVCLLSTDKSPALDGVPGNTDRLRNDLADLGVFDEQMSVYLLYKQREFAKMGFSGFEGRYYSLFGNFGSDMARAADLQTLITALAFKYIGAGIGHNHIPDNPTVESERRQALFCAAIGIPTFFVRKNGANLFMTGILEKTGGIRPSRRYPGYLRVQLHEYRKALLEVIRRDGADLIEALDLRATIDDLALRLDEPGRYSAAGRLTNGILGEVNATSPLKVKARDFNLGAERYYRETLRLEQMGEAYGFLMDEFRELERREAGLEEPSRKALRFALQGQSATGFLERTRVDLLAGKTDTGTLRKLMNLLLVTVQWGERTPHNREEWGEDATSVYRAV